MLLAKRPFGARAADVPEAALVRSMQDADVDGRAPETGFPDEAAEVKGEGGEKARLGLREGLLWVLAGRRGDLWRWQRCREGSFAGEDGVEGKGRREEECRAVREAGALFPEGKEMCDRLEEEREDGSDEGFVNVDRGRHFDEYI